MPVGTWRVEGGEANTRWSQSESQQQEQPTDSSFDLIFFPTEFHSGNTKEEEADKQGCPLDRM